MKHLAEATPVTNYSHLKKGLAAVALATVSGLAGAGIVVATTHDAAPAISRSDVEAIANKAAYNALAADRLADYYTHEASESAQSGDFIHDMQFLNGVITTSNGAGASIEFKNLIVLNINSGSENVNYDAAGAFLDGAYLGVASTDESGDLRISAIPYDATESTFKAYDPDNVVLYSPAYVQAGKTGDVLYAYDVETQATLSNPDGSVFSPQLVAK